MAETKKDQTPKEETPKLVDLYIPKGNANDEPNLMVGINGQNWLLPKGKTSKVRPEVAAEVQRAQKAQEIYDAHADELQNAAPVKAE